MGPSNSNSSAKVQQKSTFCWWFSPLVPIIKLAISTIPFFVPIIKLAISTMPFFVPIIKLAISPIPFFAPIIKLAISTMPCFVPILSCFSFRHNLPYPLLAQIEPLSSQAVRFHDRHSFTQLFIEALTYCFISAFLINHTYLSLIYVLWPRLHCRIKFSLVSFSFSVGTCPVRLGHRCRTYFPCNFRI